MHNTVIQHNGKWVVLNDEGSPVAQFDNQREALNWIMGNTPLTYPEIYEVDQHTLNVFFPENEETLEPNE